jgi:hypothetical protein
LAVVFTRTSITEIRGVHRLRTVVELAAGSVGQADISAGAILKLNRLGSACPSVAGLSTGR